MFDTLHPAIREATHLTRAGHLIEATKLLQHMLQGKAAGSPGTIADSEPAADAGGTLILDPAPGPALPPPEPSRTTFGRTTAAASHARVNRLGREVNVAELRERSPALARDLVPDGGQFLERVYANQAGSRTYKLYVPSGQHGQALPLVVMLHGCTQSPDDFAAGTRMNFLAEEHSCFVAYPGQPTSANPSKCWNWFNPGDQQRGEGEPSLIAGITRQIMQDYAIDARRIYVAGLSAGGAAAAIMGTAYSDLYAAIGVHSGLACGAASDLPSAFAAMRQDGSMAFGGHAPRAMSAERPVIPTIVFHGDQDKTVHPRNGDLVVAQLRPTASTALDRRVEHGRVPGGHAYSRIIHVDASGQAVLEQWVIHGAGHAWSGGSPAGSYTDPRGPDAAREMLRFFLEHSQRSAS
jgi:poly(hydroxyalkanoate) depolymerase family esterase